MSILRSQDLQNFAGKTGSSGKKTVIVEVRRPKVGRPDSIYGKVATSAPGILPSPFVASKSRRSLGFKKAKPESQVVSQNMNHLREVLEKLGLAEAARSNERVGYYVVDVTPGQLRELAEDKAVQAIRPNRIRRL